jgi:hypothetical protein
MIGTGVALGALTSGGSESAVRPSAAATAPAPAPEPEPLRLCGNDASNLLAAMATLPSGVQAQIGESLSPRLGDWLGRLVLFVDERALPPAPGSTTLGTILTRVSREDRDVVMRALPIEDQPTVAAAEQSAAFASLVSGTPRVDVVGSQREAMPVGRRFDRPRSQHPAQPDDRTLHDLAPRVRRGFTPERFG